MLNQSVRDHLVGTSEVTGLIEPCHPLKESDLPHPIHFLLVKLPCSHSLLPIKSLVLYRSSQLFICWMGCYPAHESWNKTSKIFKIYSVEFFFNNSSSNWSVNRCSHPSPNSHLCHHRLLFLCSLC